MSIKIPATTSINVDNSTYLVEKMSKNIQELVVLLDDWRERDANLTSELTMVKCAINNIQNQMLVAIRAERQEAVNKAKDMGIISEEEKSVDTKEE